MRPTALHLSEEHCPSLTTQVVFKDVTLFGAGGEEFRGQLTVRFRSFLPEQLLMRMTEVAYRVERLPSGPIGIGFAETMELRTAVRDAEGRYEVSPFRANVRGSLIQLWDVRRSGQDLQLRPLPHLELLEHSNSTVARVWTWGAPIGARPLQRQHGSGPAFQTQECSVRVSGRDAVLKIYAAAGAPQQGEGDASGLSYPDVEITLDSGLMPENELRRGVGGVCALITCVTGHTMNLEAEHFPLGDGRYARRFCLFDPGRREGTPHFETVPSGLLMEVVRVGTARVDRLLSVGFEFGAVSGWLHRAKTLDPPEQGFLSLFVYLESVNCNWHYVRHNRPREGRGPHERFGTLLATTLTDLLGRASALDGSFIRHRNQLIHQGVMDFACASEARAEESFRRYAELYSVCASSYLALIGWTGQWNSFGEGGLSAVAACWVPNDLTQLGVPPATPAPPPPAPRRRRRREKRNRQRAGRGRP